MCGKLGSGISRPMVMAAQTLAPKLYEKASRKARFKDAKLTDNEIGRLRYTVPAVMLVADTHAHVFQPVTRGHVEQHFCVARVKPDAASRRRTSKAAYLISAVNGKITTIED